MMKNNASHIIVVLLFLLNGLPVSVLAQTEDTLETEEVLIVKEYVPTISDAFKISDNPSVHDTTVPAPEVSYSSLNKQIATTFEVEPIRPARLRGEPLDRLQHSYVKLGLGNYLTSLADVHLNTLRSRKHALGLRIKHLASAGGIEDVGYNGYRNDHFEIYGKKFLKKHEVKGSLNYDNDKVHFYGFDPSDHTGYDQDDISQRFSKFSGDVELMSFYRDSAKLNHVVKLQYHNLVDAYNTSENYFKTDIQVSRFLQKELFRLNASIDYNNLDGDVTSAGNSLIKLTPEFIVKGDKWRVEAGMAVQSEAKNNTAFFHFYPDAHFKYNVVNDIIIPYVGINGGMIRNNYDKITGENPFLTPGTFVENSNKKYEVYAGIRGAYSSTTSFNLKASRKVVENMPFFVNDTNSIGNTFTVVYDTVTLTTITAEVGYQKTEKISLLLKGDYFLYDKARMNEFEPWHKPNYKLTLSGIYNLKDKIVLQADVFAISKQKAKVFSPEEGSLIGYDIYEKELNGIIDVNLSAEYRYTDKISGFLRMNNIAAAQYQRWNNYPVQRFQIMGGVKLMLW